MSVFLRLEPQPGASLEQISSGMVRIGQKLGIDTICRFNSIELYGWLDTIADAIVMQYEDAIQRERRRKT